MVPTKCTQLVFPAWILLVSLRHSASTAVPYGGAEDPSACVNTLDTTTEQP
jgi:hypothetical protein